MIGSQLPMVSFKPNKAPRGTPVLGGGSFTLPATSGTYTRYFSGAFDDPSDTVRYSITSSNPSLITFTNGTDVVSSQPVTVNVLQTVTSPTSVTCTITTKDKYNAVGVSNSIAITVGQYANRLVTFTSDTTWSFPTTPITQAIIYIQAQGGGGGGGGAGRNVLGTPGYGGSGAVCGTPGNMTVASYYGNPQTSPMTIRVGNSTGLGGTGGIVDTGTAGSTGEISSISSSFLNATANGGIGGNGGISSPFQAGTADAEFGSTPTVQGVTMNGSGSGTGWSIDSSYNGYITGNANLPTKAGWFATGGNGLNQDNSVSAYKTVFGTSYGNGGTGGGGAGGAINSNLSYNQGVTGYDPPTGIVRIEYIELV